MFLLLWKYHFELGLFLFFGSSLFFYIVSQFMLKRGIYTHRKRLRQVAFVFMFLSVLKATMIDIRLAKGFLLCQYGLGKKLALPFLSCSKAGLLAMDMIGVLLFLLLIALILYLYVKYIPERKVKPKLPDEVHLRFWANLSMWSVIAMLCWLATPWVGFLTVGEVPSFIYMVTWQEFAVFNFALLLYGFWRSECCAWKYQTSQRENMQYLSQTWTPKDTLWLTVFFFTIALALSYVSNDVITMGGKVQGYKVSAQKAR